MMIAVLTTLLFLLLAIGILYAIRQRRQSIQSSRLLSGLGAVSPQWVMLHRPEER